MRTNTRKCIRVRINTAERKRERIILEQETKERRNKMNKMEVDGERTKKIYLSLGSQSIPERDGDEHRV